MLFPDVDIAIRTSFLLPIASICLENISSKEKSFAIHVSVEVSVVRAIELSGALFFVNLPRNSAAKC